MRTYQAFNAPCVVAFEPLMAYGWAIHAIRWDDYITKYGEPKVYAFPYKTSDGRDTFWSYAVCFGDDSWEDIKEPHITSFIKWNKDPAKEPVRLTLEEFEVMARAQYDKYVNGNDWAKNHYAQFYKRPAYWAGFETDSDMSSVHVNY